MYKENWNYATSEESCKELMKAFAHDFRKLRKKDIKAFIKAEHKSFKRKNAIFDKKAVRALEKYLVDKKVRKRLFLLRSLLIKHFDMAEYVKARNKLAIYYTNYARKHSSHNEELYNNIMIGVICGIDSHDPFRGSTIQSTIVLYVKKHYNLDFEFDYRYPYRTSSTYFYVAKQNNIRLFESVRYQEKDS